MVLSILDSSISYEEYKTLHTDDKDLEASIFILNILDMPIMCTIGTEQYTFISKNILYVPIYLIYDSKVIGKIGVYEFNASSLTDLMDEDDELDISKLSDPLLFKYVTKEYLENYRCEDSDCEDSDKSEDEEEEDSDDGLVEDSDSDVEEVDVNDVEKEEDDDSTDESESSIGEEETKDDVIIIEGEPGKSLIQVQKELKGEDVIPEETTVIRELFEEDDDAIGEMETSKDAEKIRKQFRRSTNWVQKYFKNENFSLEDNEGGGDCLFAVIRDAYKSIGKDISVAQLRRILAREATEEVFNTYKVLYNNAYVTVTDVKKEILKLVKESKKLKKEYDQEKNRDKKRVLVDKSKVVVARHNRLKRELTYTKEMLHEYRFMHDIDTIEDFRNLIQTCKFWGETWSISTLERVLNIKLIILSSEAYRQKDYKNVLQCGQLNDAVLETRGEFKPKYYIMTEWLGQHYKSVLYKGRKILTFEQIPFDVKALVVDKCLERSEGPYAIIPKFQQIKSQIAQQEATRMGITEEEDLASESEETKKTESAKDDLFKEGVVFQFYEKSANVKPGKGNGEVLDAKLFHEYSELASIKDWRRLLSNYHPVEFKLDGLRWLSVAHYIEAMKYKKHNPELYRLFSLTSDSDVSKSVSAIKTLEKKSTFEGKEIIPSSAKIDEDYADIIMESTKDAMIAKYNQNEEAKKALKETKEAKLMQYNHRRAPTIQIELMEIRKTI